MSTAEPRGFCNMDRRRSLQLCRTAVSILEPDDVVEFGGGDLEHIAIGDRGHAMDGLRRDVDRLSWFNLALDEFVPFLDLEEHPAGGEVNGFVLLVVVLETERVAGLDVNDFSDVALGFRPVQFVTPRF